MGRVFDVFLKWEITLGCLGNTLGFFKVRFLVVLWFLECKCFNTQNLSTHCDFFKEHMKLLDVDSHLEILEVFLSSLKLGFGYDVGFLGLWCCNIKKLEYWIECSKRH